MVALGLILFIFGTLAFCYLMEWVEYKECLKKRSNTDRCGVGWNW